MMYYHLANMLGVTRPPSSGFFPESSKMVRPVDLLRDDQIEIINSDLDWHAFTADGHGRRIGRPHNRSKRSEQQRLSDPRLELLGSLVGLAEKKVVEFGCFEGIHSTSLAMSGASVIGVDARPSNLAKTILRAALYGQTVTPLLLDLDDAPQVMRAGELGLLDSDILVHIGVLYHLARPVAHLRSVLPYIREAILLDTHVARHEAEIRREFGFRDPFSGVNAYSEWLPAVVIDALLREHGFDCILDEETRDERNGLRWRTLRTKPSASQANPQSH